MDILNQPRTTLLIGAPGTGKTLFLQCLHEAARATGVRAVLLAGGQVKGDHPARAVFVDDADRLPDHVLRSLVVSGRPVILAGGPALRSRVDHDGVLTLGPLSPAMVPSFVAPQLATAGAPADLFHADAITALHGATGGVPRELRALAGLSAFLARLADTPQVLPSHVAQAATVNTGIGLPSDEGEDEDDYGGATAIAVPSAPATPRVTRQSKNFAGRLTAILACSLLVAAAALWAALGGIHSSSPASTQAGAIDPGSAPALPETPKPDALAGNASNTINQAPVPGASPSAPPLPNSPLPNSPLRVMVVVSGVASQPQGAALVTALRVHAIDAWLNDGAAPHTGPAVAFFHAEDAVAAEYVARQVGLAASDRPSPSPGETVPTGTIRIYVPAPALPRATRNGRL